MKNLHPLVGLVGLVLLGTAACAARSGEDSEAGANASPLTTLTALTCSTLVVERGSIGAGQSAEALAVRDQSGTADTWRKYVEFAPNTSAVCTFRLPASLTPAQLVALAVRLDYRGPSRSEMPWTFEVWDVSTGTWAKVGDNVFAKSWRWSPAELAVSGSAPRFFAGDVLKLRYSSTSNADASQLDELVVLATTNGESTDAGTSGSAATDSGATLDAGTPPPPPPSGALWRPAPGTSWQWQLTGAIDTSVNATMYDIDLFDTPQATIDQLHALGRKVICYFSAGSYENWRSDASTFPAASLGKNLDGWAGERWLDVRNTQMRAVMAKRMDLAVSKKCDGVEPDNVDGYANSSGFALTGADQLDYNKWLASTAHAKNLSVGLKNDVDQVAALVGDFDFAVNEECSKYNECGTTTPFIAAGKAVFHVEYGAASLATSVCPKTKALGFSTLIKKLALDAWRVACP